MKLHIDVTAQDIKDGVRKDGAHCPIALALSRAIEDVDFDCPVGVVEVNGPAISIICQSEGHYQDRRWTGMASSEAILFQEDFDGFRITEPFEFDLQVEEVTP